MSKFFNANLTEKLLFLCNISLAHDLPNVQIELAAGNGKHDCETIKTWVQVVATGLGDSNPVPVLAPDLSKKIAGLWLAGNNSDDFTDIVNPFLMVVKNCTSPGTEKQHFNALSLASNCNTLVERAVAAELSNVCSMCIAIKVQILTVYVSSISCSRGATFCLPHRLKFELSHCRDTG